MVTQAQTAPVTAAPAEPVPVAVYCRTSTLGLQDPVASVRRQLRSCQDWLPQGWFIAAVFSDVESGGTDLEARGHGDGWRVLADAGLPRDGGIADLLTEAASPVPRFAAVVCEDIERSARDMLSALRLEKQLSAQGIPLFATDEPADIAGMNATTVLVRRVKQGVAEWYRIQLKEKVWKGLVEHSMDGWNTGPAPHGYAADRVPHPNPVKAAQGRTKTRLISDPATAPTVEAIFTWRTVDKLGLPTIAARLNASPALFPAPAGSEGWAASSVDAILRNPKYTGHMVFGRHRSRGGRRVKADPAEWLWTPGPVHPVIIDRATWEAAQGIGAEHGTSRDLAAPPASAPYYLYRSRVRCKTCTKRMTGTANGPGRAYVYYRCPHQPGNPRHTAAAPRHPRTLQAPEHRLDAMAAKFFFDRIFGPGRAAFLAAQLPATDAEAAARRDTEAAALRATINKLDGQQNAQITALGELTADPGDPAAAAMRARIRERFTQLHTQRTEAEAKLATLEAATPTAMDPALLDEIPYAGDVLPGLPLALKTRLLAAFDITVLWNKPGNQVTVRAVITDATLQALPDILDPGQDGYHDTAAAPADSPLTRTPLLVSIAQTTWPLTGAGWGEALATVADPRRA
jgi:site-specific DNA recombinase